MSEVLSGDLDGELVRKGRVVSYYGYQVTHKERHNNCPDEQIAARALRA
jgi:hypothetical protein